jgi:sulfide:quinone oxidoreductase
MVPTDSSDLKAGQDVSPPGATGTHQRVQRYDGLTPMHVVIAGGGIAAVEATMALRDLAEDRVRLTIVAPERDFELKALRTAEPFAVDHVRHYPLSDMVARFGAELRPAGLSSVDADRNAVLLDDGTELGYDALVLAVGAHPRPAYDQVLTFGADAKTEVLNGLLVDLEEGYNRSVAFVVPPGVSWPLPLYELALMTAGQVFGMGIDDVRIHLVTPETSPLGIFGPEPSRAVSALLDEAGITFHGGVSADVQNGQITLRPNGERLDVQRVVALPILEGRRIPGVPADEHGFIPIDEHGRVLGLDGVYAAGDAADFPVKQGGLACQQADAVAEELAAMSGAPVEPQPFRPVLRGKLLTGHGSRFLHNALHGEAGSGRASDLMLWSPPTKVSGKYLSQLLSRPDASTVPSAAEEPHMEIEVALPNPYELGRHAMTLDPYAPVRD